MPSRECRILDKDKEIRKLKGALGHYFTNSMVWAFENDTLKKQLALALDCLNGVIKDLPWVKRTLDEIKELDKGKSND